MKKILAIFTIILLTTNAWSATITSDGSARLYFNMSAVNWWIAGTNGNGNFAYFYNSNGKYAWSAHSVKYSDSQYYVVIPSGTWNGVILTRNNTSTAPSWDNKWNQTGDITLSSTSNYISKFSEGSTSVTWGTAVKQASTGKLTASSTNVFTAVNVTLTPSLSSNADVNAIKSTSYSVSPSSNAKISGNIFSASAEGTYTITATITYHPKGYTELTSTTTASTQITVKVPAEETHNVTISYKYDDKDVQESMTTSVGVKTVSEITAPDIKGHSFVSWTLGNGITIKSGSTTSLTIGIITKSTGTYSLTANYVQNSVYFVNTARWKTVNVYAWSDDDNRNSDWPGEALTATGEQIGGYDVYKFTSGAGYENVIFNNKEGAGDGEQTPDLTWTTNKYYVYNSEGTVDSDDWYEKNQVVAVLPELVISLAGSMNGWNTELSRLVKSDDGLTASVTVLLEADTYVFKVVVNDKWLGSQETITREHCTNWTLEQGDGSDNYNCRIIADQIGEYEFVWTYATNQLSVKYPAKGEVYEPEPAPNGYRTIYLNTKNLWHSDNAKFFAHSWGADDSFQDVQLEFYIGYIYKVYVPNNHQNIIFVRMSPNATEFAWEGEHFWGQTADLTIPASKDCYTIRGWGADQGVWTTYGVDHNQDPLYSSSVPSECPDVMLQGFYWDSNQNKYYGCTRWWNLQQEAEEISSYFDLIWLPPSALSSGGVGYHPKQYSNQNSDWGQRGELEYLIKQFHDGGTKVIADMVVNHIEGKDGWCSFYEQDFGEYGYFQVDGSYISQDDEMKWDADEYCRGKAIGAKEDGYDGESNYGAARDLAHGEEKVRQMFRAYAKWMVNVMKYDGFRYDYCKGFHMSHVNDYNANAGAYFSMIEYYDGNRDVLWSRIADAGENTLALDFAMKFNVMNAGIGQFNYAACKNPNSLIGMGKGKWAVNFIDNHDTFERGNGCDFGGSDPMSNDVKDRLLQANAYMLSMPGVPCVFYPHWKAHGAAIKPMILARKAVGVHSESAVSDDVVDNGYRAYVTGTKGTLILELGAACSSCPYGYIEVAAGTGYKMYITYECSSPKLTISQGTTAYRTPTMSVTMNALGLAGTPTIYYTLDGSDPKSSNTKKTYNGAITISGTVTLKAYADVDGRQSEVQTCEYTYIPPQEQSITIAFQKPDSWSNVYLYSWDSNEEKLTGNWPGTQLTQTNAGGLYYYRFSDGQPREINFIFNNNAGTQSADLLTYEDVCYGWENNAAKLINCADNASSTIYHYGTANQGDGVYEIEDEYVGSLIYKRIFTPGKWETLYLPFEVEKVTVEDDGEYKLSPWQLSNGGNYYLAEPVGVQNGELYFDFTTTLEANKPYIIQFPEKNGYYNDRVVTFHGTRKWNELSTSFEPLKPTTQMAMQGNNTLRRQTLQENVYVLRATNDFVLQRSATTLQPFECYVLPQQATTASAAPRMRVRLRGQDDDVTTELDDVMQPTLNLTQPMYNMLGQQVDENYHGIIIQNGYKYIK